MHVDVAAVAESRRIGAEKVIEALNLSNKTRAATLAKLDKMLSSGDNLKSVTSKIK